MSIALMGAERSGKSTLARAFAKAALASASLA